MVTGYEECYIFGEADVVCVGHVDEEVFGFGGESDCDHCGLCGCCAFGWSSVAFGCGYLHGWSLLVCVVVKCMLSS